jgi:uncharacterized membrane protein
MSVWDVVIFVAVGLAGGVIAGHDLKSASLRIRRILDEERERTVSETASRADVPTPSTLDVSTTSGNDR